MKLSKNFTLEELCQTNTGLPNVPNTDEKIALKHLAENVLQPLRDLFRAPIIVTSGFRSEAVNRAVGGAPTSQHRKGEAADLDSMDNAELFLLIRKYTLFDQLIWEFGNDEQPDWVHVSYKTEGNRKEVLRSYKDKGVTKYERV